MMSSLQLSVAIGAMVISLLTVALILTGLIHTRSGQSSRSKLWHEIFGRLLLAALLVVVCIIKFNVGAVRWDASFIVHLCFAIATAAGVIALNTRYTGTKRPAAHKRIVLVSIYLICGMLITGILLISRL